MRTSLKFTAFVGVVGFSVAAIFYFVPEDRSACNTPVGLAALRSLNRQDNYPTPEWIQTKRKAVNSTEMPSDVRKSFECWLRLFEDQNEEKAKIDAQIGRVPKL